MGAAKWKGVEGFYFLGSLTIRAKQGLKPYLSTSTSVLGGRGPRTTIHPICEKVQATLTVFACYLVGGHLCVFHLR